ncbi:CD180 antigen [Pseudophryne corroboree]|uniref:CD180 antigen n=1 Tax=Pseudophryne corroboree TaxID=495146 RepID=UPI0030813143
MAEFTCFNARLSRRELYVQVDEEIEPMSNINHSDGEVIKGFFKLEQLLKDEMRHWWDSVSLKKYLTSKQIPRGLRIFKTLGIQDDPTLLSNWDRSLDECSFKLIELLVNYREKKVIEIGKKIEEIKGTLIKYKDLPIFSERDKNTNKRVEQFEKELVETKNKKLLRDDNDYKDEKPLSPPSTISVPSAHEGSSTSKDGDDKGIIEFVDSCVKVEQVEGDTIIVNKSYSCEGLGLQEIPDSLPTSIESLDFSFNILFALYQWTFGHLEKLEYLDLSRCCITWIHEDVFRNNTKLHTVMLTGNPILYIADSAFVGATSLRHLYLQETSILDLEFVPIINLPNLETLHVGSNSISSIKLPEGLTLKNLRTMNFELNRINKITVEDSQFLKQINNLTLILKGNNIEYIEPNSFNTSNFYSLDLMGCAWKTDLSLLVNGLNGLTTNILKIGTFIDINTEMDIFPQSLGGLCNVSAKQVSLQVRQFTDESPQTFSCLTKTEILDFTYTHIVSLPRLTNGPVLRELILNENKFSSLCNISSNSYPLLMHLHIVGNFHTLDLGAGCLKDLSRLQYLDLSHNDFGQMACCSAQFTGLHSLNHLNLSYGSILSLDSPAFPENDQLEVLDFTHAHLLTGKSVSPFSNLANLRVLNLSQSYVNTSNIHLFDGLKNLIFLNMDKSSFQNATLRRNNLFSNVVKLDKLILSNCDLQTIEGEAFLKLLHLKYVDLSHNKLTLFSTNAFWNLSHIYLNLAFNMITTIPIGLLQNITDESTINLSQNPIDCSCSNVEFLSWYKKHENIFEDKTKTLCGSPPSLNGTELSKATVICGMSTSYLILIIILVLVGAMLVAVFIIKLYKKRMYSSI